MNYTNTWTDLYYDILILPIEMNISVLLAVFLGYFHENNETEINR